MAEFAGAVAETQGKIDAQLATISQARKSVADGFKALFEAIANFNQQLFSAKLEAAGANFAIQQFISGISSIGKIDFIRTFFEENIAIVGGSEKRILELRKQGSTEIINILRDEITSIRSIGQEGFTSSFEDIIKRRLGDSLARGIAQGTVNPLSVSRSC